MYPWYSGTPNSVRKKSPSAANPRNPTIEKAPLACLFPRLVCHNVGNDRGIRLDISQGEDQGTGSSIAGLDYLASSTMLLRSTRPPDGVWQGFAVRLAQYPSPDIFTRHYRTSSSTYLAYWSLPIHPRLSYLSHKGQRIVPADRPSKGCPLYEPQPLWYYQVEFLRKVRSKKLPQLYIPVRLVELRRDPRRDMSLTP